MPDQNSAIDDIVIAMIDALKASDITADIRRETLDFNFENGVSTIISVAFDELDIIDVILSPLTYEIDVKISIAIAIDGAQGHDEALATRGVMMRDINDVLSTKYGNMMTITRGEAENIEDGATSAIYTSALLCNIIIETDHAI